MLCTAHGAKIKYFDWMKQWEVSIRSANHLIIYTGFFPKKEKEEEDIIKLFLSSRLYIHVYILPKLEYIYVCISFEVKGSQVYIFFLSYTVVQIRTCPRRWTKKSSTSRPHFTNKIKTKTQIFFFFSILNKGYILKQRERCSSHGPNSKIQPTTTRRQRKKNTTTYIEKNPRSKGLQI